MRPGLLLVLLSLAVGCSGKDERAPDAAAPALPPARPVADLLPAKPGLPKPVGALRLDMDRAAALKALPELKGGEALPLAGYDGVEVRVSFHADGERVRFVMLTAPEAAADAVVARWGAPEKVKVARTRQVELWVAADARVQIVLEREPGLTRLTFWPFTPWRELLGASPDALGFERTPILGKPQAELLQAYAAHRPKVRDGRVDLWLSRTEYADAPLVARVTFADGVASEVVLRMEYMPRPALREELLAAFAKKWGAPAEGEKGVLSYAGETVLVDDDPHSMRLRVRVRRAPTPDERPRNEPTPAP